MHENEAISLFKRTFSMYANASLTAQNVAGGWEIYVEGVEDPIGIVRTDGTPELY